MRREMVLAGDASSVHAARALLNRLVPPPVLGERHIEAILVVSELVTNAVKYGALGRSDTIRMVIETDERKLRVEVEQLGSASEARQVEPRMEGNVGGFGLDITERLADAWGAVSGPPGHVWFEFQAPGKLRLV